jgi:hypothetical protein
MHGHTCTRWRKKNVLYCVVLVHLSDTQPRNYQVGAHRQIFISAESISNDYSAVFFSYNKSANNNFYHNLSAKVPNERGGADPRCASSTYAQCPYVVR